MRITTNMLARNYQNSLSKNIGGLSEARNAVLTGRRFTKLRKIPEVRFQHPCWKRKYVRIKATSPH